MFSLFSLGHSSSTSSLPERIWNGETYTPLLTEAIGAAKVVLGSCVFGGGYLLMGVESCTREPMFLATTPEMIRDYGIYLLEAGVNNITFIPVAAANYADGLTHRAITHLSLRLHRD